MYRNFITRQEGLDDEDWEEGSDMILSWLRRATPVKTGHLRDSWQDPQVGRTRMALGNDADYAPYVFEGTPKMAARDVVGEVQDMFDQWAMRKLMAKMRG